MVINYDTMEDILDDESIVNFSKPNRKKTHPTGLTKYDDPWYKNGYRNDAISRNWAKIKGILKKNIGKDFGKVRNEIIQKCAHNDYDRYLIKDYLQYRVYNYTNVPNYAYLRDMFYIDKNGKLQYRAKPEVEIKMKDNRYASFPTPEDDRIYRYEFRKHFLKPSRKLEILIEHVFYENFPNWFDYDIRSFKEDEINIILNELLPLAPLIKSIDPVYYKYYKHFHFNNQVDITEKEIDKYFIKSYLFTRYCVNPYTMVKKNSQEYWKLRKLFNKNR